MISIIVPVYRVEEYLSDCINSILSQTYKDFELILVDDGSDDQCPSICDDYAIKDSRIKVIHKYNGGLVSARKAGAHVASGEYVINVDSDDLVVPSLLESLVDIINKNHPDAVSYGFEKFDDETGNVVASQSFPSNMFYEGEKLNMLKTRYLYDEQSRGINGGYIPHAIWAKAVKRDLYISCQNIVPDYVSKGEDTLFTLKLLNDCESYYTADFIGYRYRYRKQSMINSSTDKDFKELNRLVDEMKSIVGNTTWDNQIAMYAYKRINDLITITVNNKVPYKEFKKSVISAVDILEKPFIEDLKIRTHLKWKEKLLIRFIKNKAWHWIYFYKILN